MTTQLEVGIKELDSWLFKGFGGLASAVYNRVKGDGQHVPINPTAMKILKESSTLLSEAVEKYKNLPIGQLSPADYDLWFAHRFAVLVNFIVDRTIAGPEIRDDSAINILVAESERWIKQMVPGMETFNERLA